MRIRHAIVSTRRGESKHTGAKLHQGVTADRVAVRFFLPSPQLAPYVSTYYLTEVSRADGQLVEDWLHPEWTNLRLSNRGGIHAALGAEPLRPVPAMNACGPTSQCVHFTLGPARIWGVGILPLGWARFFDEPAVDHADRFSDLISDPAYQNLAPLCEAVFAGPDDPVAEVGRIDAYFLQLLSQRPASPHEALIKAAHQALIDEDIKSVAEFAAHLAMSSRTLERLCLRAFGYPPKLLLRRQRFLRSMSQFLLDPSLSWIKTLDWHYVDQAHFVRDFKRFMGMSPSAYSAREHPILGAAAKARAATFGAAVQALHKP